MTLQRFKTMEMVDEDTESDNETIQEETSHNLTNFERAKKCLNGST